MSLNTSERNQLSKFHNQVKISKTSELLTNKICWGYFCLLFKYPTFTTQWVIGILMGLKKVYCFCDNNKSKMSSEFFKNSCKKSDNRGIPFGKAAVFEILKMFIYLLTMCEPLYVHWCLQSLLELHRRWLATY